ncbi:hypothetical protein [Enterococcus hirae]|uniref:hypothetical protein n=1 Tax=Enterococcus hirae TaxID=1354 RepID=UPI001CBEE746|nr:hypothetical protein [Enterococcus hirae]MCA6767231.1 hypothetical protein [Enterococcus hirae]MCL4597173.1 hypothetical protein [Enterococcus hirae]MCV3103898.1 hypothetical protein [Enterococcus hirae]MCV3108741.1 hypothetical protein [Enterococcus hirae]MCV3111370.1 hypothetical protein [Enterococcus hirae]
MKKIVDHKGLCLAMILSISCFLTLYYIYDFYLDIEGLFLELLMIILGITGIYLSMKIRQTRWRWFLLGINYFFCYPFANTCCFQYLCEIFLAMSVKIRANELK